LTALSVTLRNEDGLGIGVLAEHPAKPQVVTQRIRPHRRGEPALSVSLWDGKCQIGEGTLTAVRGRWTGQVSEFAGLWHVDGKCGEPTLWFSERAP
jgi:hypothetical protein